MIAQPGHPNRVRDGAQGHQAAVRALEDSKNLGQEWRKNSYDTSPWVRHWHEMASKTMVRRLSKWLSMSIEFANAAALDAMSETGTANFAAFTDDNTGALMDASVVQIEHRPEMEMQPVQTGEKGEPEPSQPG